MFWSLLRHWRCSSVEITLHFFGFRMICWGFLASQNTAEHREPHGKWRWEPHWENQFSAVFRDYTMKKHVQKYIPPNPIHTYTNCNLINTHRGHFFGLKTNPTKKSQVESPQVPKNDKNPDPGLPDPLAATSKLRAVDLGQVEASLHLHPPPLGGAILFSQFFFLGFWFLDFLVVLFWFVAFFEGLAKKKSCRT